MKQFQEWARHEYSLRQRIIALFFEGIFFLCLFPLFLVVASNAIDGWLHLPRFYAGAVSLVAGLLLVAGGAFLGFWSIGTQVTIGRGTPVPLMPTQKLLIQGPFAYCRNPMTLGTDILYTGVSVWIGSLSALAIVAALVLLLLVYLKRVEEKELEARFGPEYVEYKRRTPFILPRLRSKN